MSLRSFFSYLFCLLSLIALQANCAHKPAQALPASLAFSSTYLKAKSLEATSASAACQTYLSLAGEKKFSLATLALLQAHLICEHPEQLPPLPADLLKTSPWLESLDVDRQIREATLAKKSGDLALALVHKSQLNDRTGSLDAKVNLLLLAQSQPRLPAPVLSEVQSRLYKLAPRYLPHPQKEDYFRVGTDLIYQRQFNQGRAYFKKIITDTSFSADEKYMARRARRNSYKIQQNSSEYLKYAALFAKWCEKNTSLNRTYEATLILARAQWTQGHKALARQILNHAEKIFKGKIPLDEINFVRGKIFEEEHQYDKALQALTEAQKEADQNSSAMPSAYRDRIYFSKAWVLLKLKRSAEAAENFKVYRDLTLDPFEHNKASFWYARALNASAKKLEAQKEFQSLEQSDPMGFYGLVSYRELNQPMPALFDSKQKASIDDVATLGPRPRGVSASDHELIQALTEVHEDDLLTQFLDGKAQELKTAKNLDQNEWLYFLKGYAQAGLYSPLFTQIGTLPPEMKSQIFLQNPELLFPQRYVDLAKTWGTKLNVSPELIMSIIRQESSFNPFARSGADAFGLMQLLPSVAKENFRKVKIPVKNFVDLYKPEVNIPYGAALLASLQKKYRGQFVLTVASYNANEKAISGWLQTRLQSDPLEFIEDVPYEETRAYIKLVLRNFIFYSRLAAPGQALSFPEHCLDDLHSFKVSTH